MNYDARFGGEAFAALGKSAPPVTISALSVAGVGLQDWVFILTAGYIVLQGAYLLWKWVRELRAKKADANG